MPPLTDTQKDWIIAYLGACEKLCPDDPLGRLLLDLLAADRAADPPDLPKFRNHAEEIAWVTKNRW